MIVLDLPYPPSLNALYRPVTDRVSGKPKIVEGAKNLKAFVNCVWGEVLEKRHLARPLTGPLAVATVWAPPDRRRRDQDNLAKALLDALTAAKLWLDDSQIHFAVTARAPVTAGGQVTLIVDALDAAQDVTIAALAEVVRRASGDQCGDRA